MSLIEDLNIVGGKYRYLTCLGRLIGANGKYERIDADQGQVLQQESAANGFDGEEYDYAEVSVINAIGTTYEDRNDVIQYNGNQIELSMPTQNDGDTTGRLWTHYSI